LRQSAEAAGRSSSDIEITVWPGSADPKRELDPAWIREYLDAGATRIITRPQIMRHADTTLPLGPRRSCRVSSEPTAVTIFDEVVLPVAGADAWLERWRAEYLPGALERGLSLQGAWRGYSQDPGQAVVVIQWKVATIGAFFASRGGVDAAVMGFWEATDQLAISRNRRVLADAGITP
jgi:hypothetical protein